MAAIVVTTTIGIAGVAFLIRFLIALCKEDRVRACHVVRIRPDSRWQVDPEEWPSSDDSRDIFRGRPPAHAEQALNAASDWRQGNRQIWEG